MAVISRDQLKISSLSSRKRALERQCREKKTMDKKTYKYGVYGVDEGILKRMEDENKSRDDLWFYLAQENADLKKKLENVGKRFSQTMQRSIKRAKQLKAIEMILEQGHSCREIVATIEKILDGTLALDTRKGEPQIVLAEELPGHGRR